MLHSAFFPDLRSRWKEKKPFKEVHVAEYVQSITVTVMTLDEYPLSRFGSIEMDSNQRLGIH